MNTEVYQIIKKTDLHLFLAKTDISAVTGPFLDEDAYYEYLSNSHQLGDQSERPEHTYIQTYGTLADQHVVIYTNVDLLVSQVVAGLAESKHFPFGRLVDEPDHYNNIGMFNNMFKSFGIKYNNAKERFEVAKPAAPAKLKKPDIAYMKNIILRSGVYWLNQLTGSTFDCGTGSPQQVDGAIWTAKKLGYNYKTSSFGPSYKWVWDDTAKQHNEVSIPQLTFDQQVEESMVSRKIAPQLKKELLATIDTWWKGLALPVKESN